ncbi:HAD-IA family hydrolase [Celeribacter arenosi]|uniref:phosphoglycolate phosphatase n=1 Tax=Celeribacter arenosi TaxID=792649 RepID=A0ABP7JZH6_9RHOB
MKPDLLIFDCDGVLVDSEPPTLALLRDDLDAHGLTLTMDDIERDYTGLMMSNVAKKAVANGATLPDTWVPDFYAKMFDRLRDGVALIVGIESALDALDAAGIPYCVASNGPMEKMEITLGAHPAFYKRLAGRLHSAHTHGTGKPDPELLLIAARSMGVDPTRAIMIDDSPSGCIAAARANMRCFGFDTRGDGAHLTATGAEHLAAMADLPARLGLTNPR